MHIPDGVLPLWLWAGGWALALVLVFAAGRVSDRSAVRRKVPLLGVVAALMLVAMSSEIVPIAYHINLAVVGGILLGPALSIIAAFIVQVVLAMLGHGGVTVLGLNTILIAAEMVLGWMLFRIATRMLGRKRPGLSTGLATVLTLAATTTMLVGVVALAGGGATMRESGALDPDSLTFRAPFTDGVFEVGLFSGGEEHSDGDEEVHPGDHADDEDAGAVAVMRFAAIAYTIGPIGWLLEALISAAVVGYVARVRPTLIFEGALAEERVQLPGDAQGGH